jgi:fatty acid desaturase
VHGFLATRRATIEWPTVFVVTCFAVVYALVTETAGRLPVAVTLPALALLGAMHMSLQHEILHNHPTQWTAVNTAIGFIPLSLWLPFTRYKHSHIVHHTVELTDPVDDPESFYVNPDQWLHAGPLWRAFLRANRTLLGRMTIGAAYGMLSYVWSEALKARHDRQVAAQWAAHIGGSVVIGWWLFAVNDVAPALYIAGFSFGGYSLTLLRSFAEHRATDIGTRCAVIKASAPMALLYLNNNLHHTHHALPDAPWYRLPDLHDTLEADQIAAAGAGLYPGGYLEVARRYLLRPFCQPVHPTANSRKPEPA